MKLFTLVLTSIIALSNASLARADSILLSLNSPEVSQVLHEPSIKKTVELFYQIPITIKEITKSIDSDREVYTFLAVRLGANTDETRVLTVVKKAHACVDACTIDAPANTYSATLTSSVSNQK